MNESVKQKIGMTKERLKKSLDSYIIDDLTGCYNHIFLKEYLINELDLIDFKNETLPNLTLIFIKIDDILDINIKYSNKIGDETIANLAYLLKENLKNNEIVFKLTGPNFVILLHDFRSNIVSFTRNIQNKVKKSDIFIEPITVSSAVLSLRDLDLVSDTEHLATTFITKGISRINLSREIGNSALIDKDTVVERTLFGKILLADSDDLTVSIMKSYFEQNKYEVQTVSNGLDALNEAKAVKFDVIIADRYIKKIDGLTLKKYINESSLNMNTIFLLTIQSKNIDIINKANQIAVDFVFDKPVILEEILGIIKREAQRKACTPL